MINKRLAKNIIFSDVNNHAVDYPTPINVNYFWGFGALALLFLGVQVVTGIFLAMHYTSDTTMAFFSVERIMRDISNGWLIRYAHANGASFFFLMVYVHIFRGLYYGSYLSPRKYLWFSGILIFFLMMAIAFLGYVLPWGQMSFWGATVITNLFSAIPVVGDDIVQWLWGGFAVANPTLQRFFALHFLLPFVLIGAVGLHVVLLHTPGSNNPLGIPSAVNSIPFYPYIVIKDIFLVICILFVFIYIVCFDPNKLGHPDNYIPGNPLVTPLHIVPEWYFLPFYAILRAIPNKLLGVVAMGASILILAILPFLPFSNISQSKSYIFKPLNRIFYWIFVFVFIGLLKIGEKSPEAPYVLVGQLLTVYYFSYFLIILPTLNILHASLFNYKKN
uniref:Cytochrome b n=1 Tax=Colponema vietnamica TaxID=1492817 RepID=V5KV60_9ALVE|nr:apocytochrome b [Colponema vietnamica]ATY40859.1 apocytochrome b [Colponema vietnamica]